LYRYIHRDSGSPKVRREWPLHSEASALTECDQETALNSKRGNYKMFKC